MEAITVANIPPIYFLFHYLMFEKTVFNSPSWRGLGFLISQFGKILFPKLFPGVNVKVWKVYGYLDSRLDSGINMTKPISGLFGSSQVCIHVQS